MKSFGGTPMKSFGGIPQKTTIYVYIKYACTNGYVICTYGWRIYVYMDGVIYVYMYIWITSYIWMTSYMYISMTSYMYIWMTSYMIYGWRHTKKIKVLKSHETSKKQVWGRNSIKNFLTPHKKLFIYHPLNIKKIKKS